MGLEPIQVEPSSTAISTAVWSSQGYRRCPLSFRTDLSVRNLLWHQNSRFVARYDPASGWQIPVQIQTDPV